MEWAQEAIL